MIKVAFLFSSLSLWVILVGFLTLSGYLSDKSEAVKTFSMFIATSLLFLIFGFVAQQEFVAPNKKIEQEIYSINSSKNSIEGSFILGSGFINSKEMYLAEIRRPDGGFERFYIPVTGTVKYEKTLKNTGTYEEELCVTRSLIEHLLDAPSEKDDLHRCEMQTPKRKLYVPEGTVVQKFNL